MSLGTLEIGVAADVTDAVSGLNHVGAAADDAAASANQVTGGFDQIQGGADQTGQSLEGLGDDSNKSGSALAKLGPKGAAAGAAIAGVAAIGAAVVGATAKIASLTNEAAQVGDELHKMALRTGLPTDELQRLEHAAGQSGVEMDDVVKTISKTDRPLGDLADDVANASTQQEAMAIASEELGDGMARKMMPMLVQGSEGIEDLGDEAEDLGGIMSSTAVAAGAEFQDALGRLDQSSQGLRNTLGENLLPIATEAIDVFIGFRSAIVDALPAGQGMGETLQNLARSGMLVVADAAINVTERVGNLARSLMTNVEGINTLINVIHAGVRGFMGFQSAISAVRKLIISLATDAIGTLVQGLGTLVRQAASFADNIPMIGDDLAQGMNLAADMADELGGDIDDLSETVRGSAEDDFEGFLDQVEAAGDAMDDDRSAEIRAALEGIAEGSDEARENLAELRGEIDEGEFEVDLDEAQEEAERRSRADHMPDDDEDEDSSDDDERDDDTQDEINASSEEELELIRLKTQALQELDQVESLRLEKQIREQELAVELAEIREQELTDEEEALRLEQARAEAASDRRDIDEQITRLTEQQADNTGDAADAQEEQAHWAEVTADHLGGAVSIGRELSGAMDQFGGETEEAQKAVDALNSGIQAAQSAQAMFNAIAAANPLGAIAAAIGVIIGGIGAMTSIMDDIDDADVSVSRSTGDKKRDAEMQAKAIGEELERRNVFQSQPIENHFNMENINAIGGDQASRREMGEYLGKEIVRIMNENQGRR